MQDNFEKFVNNNREEFDMAEPNFKIWENIEQQLNEQSTKKSSPLRIVKSERKTVRMRIMRYASVAAVGLLLLTVGGFIGSYLTTNNSPMAANEISLSDVSDEYAEVETFYAQQVNMKIEELKQYNYDESILKDIAELDAAFQELKQELGNAPDMTDEEIIHAMIENYQMKIDILERVLERSAVERSFDNAEKSGSNEKSIL